MAKKVVIFSLLLLGIFSFKTFAEIPNNDCFLYDYYVQCIFDENNKVIPTSATAFSAPKGHLFEIQFDYQNKYDPQNMSLLAYFNEIDGRDTENIALLGVWTPKDGVIEIEDSLVKLFGPGAQVVVNYDGTIILFFIENERFQKAYYFFPEDKKEVEIYKVRYELLIENLERLVEYKK